MANRGTSNAPNTRNPERPHSHPSRLDQYGKGLDDEQDNNSSTKKERKK